MIYDLIKLAQVFMGKETSLLLGKRRNEGRQALKNEQTILVLQSLLYGEHFADKFCANLETYLVLRINLLLQSVSSKLALSEHIYKHHYSHSVEMKNTVLGVPGLVG